MRQTIPHGRQPLPVNHLKKPCERYILRQSLSGAQRPSRPRCAESTLKRRVTSEKLRAKDIDSKYFYARQNRFEHYQWSEVT